MVNLFMSFELESRHILFIEYDVRHTITKAPFRVNAMPIHFSQNLGHIEGMVPVVVEHLCPVVLLDCQQPPAQGLVVNTEPRHQVQLVEHSRYTTFRGSVWNKMSRGEKRIKKERTYCGQIDSPNKVPLT